jgi:hypothetical protein
MRYSRKRPSERKTNHRQTAEERMMLDDQKPFVALERPTRDELKEAFPDVVARIEELESEGLTFDQVVERLFAESIDATSRDRKRLAELEKLPALGFTPVGGWLFAKDGRTYDLIVADLSQIERIEREGMFVVEEKTAAWILAARERPGRGPCRHHPDPLQCG